MENQERRKFKMICPNCEDERTVEKIDKQWLITVKGEDFKVNVKLWRCLECNQVFDDPDNPIDELDLAHRMYSNKKIFNLIEEIYQSENFNLKKYIEFSWNDDEYNQFDLVKLLISMFSECIKGYMWERQTLKIYVDKSTDLGSEFIYFCIGIRGDFVDQKVTDYGFEFEFDLY